LHSTSKPIKFAETLDGPSLPDPVFRDSKHDITLYQADCLDILAALPEGHVDLIFADPPYFLSNGGITCHAGRMVSVNKGSWDRSRGPDANHEFNRAWLASCQRVLKPNPPPNLSCRYFTHATETIIWAAKSAASKHKFNYQAMRQEAGGKQMKSVWQIRPPEPEEKRFGKHPTQKPIALLDRILRASSDPGDVVLDPFTGSATTMLAACRLRRSAIGCELSAEWLDGSLRRICSELVQVEISIFCYHSFPLISFPILWIDPSLWI
jgi:site-specific DNA-methyltransferase (adenine-specific)